MAEVKEKHGMGWLPDYPDFRDYTPEHKIIAPILKITKVTEPAKIPGSIDLKEWCSPIENQGSLGSCTAHAGAGLVEYFEKRVFHHYIDDSRRFLYKVTRNIMHVTGDTGAFLRTTMGAMVLFGVPARRILALYACRF